MIDSLVAYPLDPVQLEMGLNVIGCASPKIFYELSAGLQEDADSVVLDVGEKTVLASKSIIYIGDCADEVDYNALFQKLAVKKIIEGFTPEQISRLLSLQAELKTIIQDEIWGQNLPLTIPCDLDLKAAIAMAKPRIDTSSLGSLYDKISTAVDTAGALAESRMLVTLHTTQYCDNDQLLYLHRTLLRYQLQLLDLECCSKKVMLTEGMSHYVDEDYVQFS